LLTSNEVGVARIGDLNTTQHLTHDYFNVLVIDLYALQSINVLHLINNVDR